MVQGEWEWDFIIERLIGKMVADGKAEVPGQGRIKAGALQGAMGGMTQGVSHMGGRRGHSLW